MFNQNKDFLSNLISSPASWLVILLVFGSSMGLFINKIQNDNDLVSKAVRQMKKEGCFYSHYPPIYCVDIEVSKIEKDGENSCFIFSSKGTLSPSKGVKVIPKNKKWISLEVKRLEGSDVLIDEKIYLLHHSKCNVIKVGEQISLTSNIVCRKKMKDKPRYLYYEAKLDPSVIVDGTKHSCLKD